MKKTIMYLIILFANSTASFGQDVLLESNEEELDSANFSSLLKTYNSVIRVDEEEIQLFKIDLLGPFLYGLTGKDTAEHNVLGIAFEKKIKPIWSWIASATVRASREKVTNIWFASGVRNYYNMNKRILKGKSANNFSANYFSATLNTQLRPAESDEQLSINILYGIQRRLGKRGFVDWNVGLENILVPYSDKSVGIDFVTQISLGLGF